MNINSSYGTTLSILSPFPDYLLLTSHHAQLSLSSFNNGVKHIYLNVDVKILNVGEELFKETLPLRMGSRYYQLQGLKANTWYEVKISYPSSIPAVFSLELKKDISGVGVRKLRKLLNTEKLIFKAEDLDKINHQDGLYVLITVEPEGVVALRGVQERENILFNIVCDELVMGIPREAWLIAAFGVACIVVGFLVPLFLPSFLLPKNQDDFKHVTQLLPDKDS